MGDIADQGSAQSLRWSEPAVQPSHLSASSGSENNAKTAGQYWTDSKQWADAQKDLSYSEELKTADPLAPYRNAVSRLKQQDAANASNPPGTLYTLFHDPISLIEPDTSKSRAKDGQERSLQSLNDLSESKRSQMQFRNHFKEMACLAMPNFSAQPPPRDTFTKAEDLAPLRAVTGMIEGKANFCSGRTTNGIQLTKDTSLDLGGAGISWLYSAKTGNQLSEQLTKNLIEAKQAVTRANGQASVPDQKEIDGLETYEKNIDTKIDGILNGKHDIKAAVNELDTNLGYHQLPYAIEDVERNIRNWQVTYWEMKRRMTEAGEDPAVMQRKLQENLQIGAKLYRDDAALYLAMAQNLPKQFNMDNELGNGEHGPHNSFLVDGLLNSQYSAGYRPHWINSIPDLYQGVHTPFPTANVQTLLHRAAAYQQSTDNADYKQLVGLYETLNNQNKKLMQDD